MDFFRGVGNFFRGIFGRNDDEERKRREREAQQRQQQQQQWLPPMKAPTVDKPQKVQNVQQLFGMKKDKSLDLGIPKQLFQQQQSQPTAPKPKINPNAIRQRAQSYQQAGVQDVNNYYGNDLKVLNEELAKGDQADWNRITAVMQSLDNRRDELKRFHETRGQQGSFKSARALEERIKETRGDWTKENEKLSKFWDIVAKREAGDFEDFLKGKTRDYRVEYFKDEEEKVKEIRDRQKIVDEAMKYKDIPLDQLGNFTIQQYLDDFAKQSPEEQRYIMDRLNYHMETIGDNPSHNKELQRKVEQAYILSKVLEDSGLQRSNFRTRLQDIGRGVKNFGSAFVESPKRVGQSIGALAGDDPAGDIFKDWQDGKLTDEEFNKKMAQHNKDYGWVPDDDASFGERLLTSAGTSADTVATFLPVGSLVKGGKAVWVTNKLVQEGLARGMTEAMAKKFAADALKKTPQLTMKQIIAQETAANAAFSGVGSLRDGEFNAKQTVTETALGAGIGAGAPLVGNAATRLWRRLRGANTAVPEALEDVGRVTSRLEGDIAEEVAEDATQQASRIKELRSIADDLDMPAFQRQAAKAELQALEEAATPRVPGSQLDEVPAFQHRQNIQNVIRREEDNLNRFLNENPNLTRQQVEAARAAAQERTMKLVEELQANRTAGLEAVEGQAAATDEAVQAQQAAAETVQAQAAARTTPEPGQVVQAETPSGSPEVAANDAYKRFNDEAGITSGSQDITYIDAQQQLEAMAGNRTMADLAASGRLPRIPTAINNRTQGAVASGVTDVAGRGTGRLLQSQNPVLNFMGQVLYGLNKKSTLTNAQKQLVEQVRGRRGGIGNLRGQVVQNIETPIAQFDQATQAAIKEKVFKAFELYNNGQIDESLAIIKTFAPEERAYFDGIRELNVLRNNLNRSTMSLDTIDAYANGMHMPRIYDQAAFAKEFDEDALEAFAISQNKTLDLNPAKRRKQLEEISEELRESMLRDPAQASAIRTEIALHNKGVSDYASQVAMIPEAVADKSVRGFLEIPDSAKYGSLSGKWVRKDLAEPMLNGEFRFKSDTYRAVNKLLDKYQSSVLGKLENGLRKILTVYNPATRLGNRGANLTQGAMAGFNLPEMAVRQQHFVNVLKKGGDEWTRLARAFGAIDDNEALARFSGEVTEPRGRFRRRASDSYTDIDTAAKVAMFEWQIKRGATPEQAARFVNRALPNIGNSGEIYSFFSRLPVLGVPFRAIQPEVLRSLASSASRHTVPFLVAMGTYTTLQNMSWEGVPEEERRQIQERFGSGQTPFASINKFFGEKGIPTDKVLPSSWSFNAGALFGTDPETGERRVVDVDPRRLLGVYSINLGGESAADSVVDQALKASPANIPVTFNNGDWNFAPQNIVGSRVFSPLYQAAIDRDFRGKSVQDPEGKIYDPESLIDNRFMTEGGQVDNKSDPNRLMNFLLRSYIPQVGEVQNIQDARAGRENFYGQQMNVPQTIARLFGLKGEEFTQDRLQDMRDTQEFYDELKFVQDQVKGLSKSDQEAYIRLTGLYKLRDGKVPNEFEPGSMRYRKAPQYEFSEDKWKEYAAHPNLYNLMVEKKQREFARDGKPIQPEFDPRLSEAFRRQLIQNKMVAPGDDAELDQRMYSSPEWDYYMNLKDAYKAAASQYYPDSGQDDYVDELVKHQDAKFPEKPEILKQYSAAYARYANGQGTKPEFTDAVKAAKEAYNQQTFIWTNNERRARGLPAITWDVWNNPTFGFDESPSGFGYGYGNGGSGYRFEDHINTLGQLSNFTASVDRLKPIEAAAMPQLIQFFNALQAPRRGGRASVPLGARSTGL